jgi:hypothetical protein
MPRQQPDRLLERHRLAVAHEEAADRRVVVVRREPAFAHLPERHEGDHLRAVERDVGEQCDIDDLADEHVERGFVLAVDDREGRRFGGEGEQRGKQAGHVGLRSGPRPGHPVETRNDRPRAVVVRRNARSPPRRRATSCGSTWS